MHIHICPLSPLPSPDPYLVHRAGGWDNTVQVWDVRVGYAVRSIYGPHICGDSLDLDGNTIVTGTTLFYSCIYIVI